MVAVNLENSFDPIHLSVDRPILGESLNRQVPGSLNTRTISPGLSEFGQERQCTADRCDHYHFQNLVNQSVIFLSMMLLFATLRVRQLR